MMLNCREVSRLLASGEADRGPALRRVLIRLHLMMCDSCHRYAGELRRLSQTAREVLHAPVHPTRLAELEREIVNRATSPDAHHPEAD